MERKIYVDNIRWITVLLVVLYHIFYMFNAEGVFGGIGSFADVQYQDALCYVLYPWFMLLLFVVAGMSSRWALERQEDKLGSRKAAHRQFIRSRTLKLLVPSTIGMLVFHWMTGWLNVMTSPGAAEVAGLPGVIRYFVFVISGFGPLWFIQDLWLFSLLLVVIRLIDKKDRLYTVCGKLGEMNAITVTVALMALAALVWLVAQPTAPVSLDKPQNGLLNLYRPLFYFTGYLIGYFVLAHDDVVEKLSSQWAALLLFAVTCAIVFVVNYFGKDYTAVLTHRDTNIFAWFGVLAFLACGRRWLNKTSAFGTYMTRCSFGIYILHYLPTLALAYTLKTFTTLPPVVIYLILLVSVLPISVALYETIRRIPFIRWCILGLARRKNKA